MTCAFGWKNEKQPSGPIELDLEAGNLVSEVNILIPESLLIHVKLKLKQIFKKCFQA